MNINSKASYAMNKKLRIVHWKKIKVILEKTRIWQAYINPIKGFKFIDARFSYRLASTLYLMFKRLKTKNCVILCVQELFSTEFRLFLWFYFKRSLIYLIKVLGFNKTTFILSNTILTRKLYFLDTKLSFLGNGMNERMKKEILACARENYSYCYAVITPSIHFAGKSLYNKKNYSLFYFLFYSLTNVLSWGFYLTNLWFLNS
jgi:hypothetical protein